MTQLQWIFFGNMSIPNSVPSIIPTNTADVTFNVNATAISNDFFKTTQLGSVFKDISIENAFTVRPLVLSAGISSENLQMNIKMQDKLTLNVLLDNAENSLNVNFSAQDALLEDIVKVNDTTVLGSFYDDVFSAYGNLAYNSQEKKADYMLRVTNLAQNDDTVLIDIKGDEKNVNIEEMIIQAESNFFTWKGSLALDTLSPNGGIQFNLGYPIINVPTRGAFLLSQTTNTTIGKSLFFFVNNIEQPPMSLVYKPVQKNLNVFFDNKLNPTFSFSQRENGQEISMQMYEYPLDTVLASALNIDKTVFQNYTVSADLSLELERFSVNFMEYVLDIKDANNKISASIEGTFDTGVWDFISTVNMFPASRDINMTFEGIYTQDNNIIDGQATISTAFDSTPLVYKINSLLENDQLSIFINDDSSIKISNVYNDLGKERAITANIVPLLLPLGYKIEKTVISLKSFNNVWTSWNISTELKNETNENAHIKQFETTSNFSRDRGTISVLKLFALNESFIGGGDISYINDVWSVILNEYPKARVNNASSAPTPPREYLRASYNVKNESFNLDLREVVLGLFSRDVSGVLSTRISGKKDLSEYSIAVAESDIYVNTTP